MRYLSICSGIEAASVAWHSLGWKAAGFAEIAAFPSAVLAHRWPGVPNFGDFTHIEASDVGPIDLLVGGTPCQTFSIAGLREGLRDDRGNLALEYSALARRCRPRWLVWENVPGVLSSNGGRDFGSIVGAMVECGYGFAYRILDAQYFGVPQRRRRVLLIGYLGDWRPAAAVLFERQSLRRDFTPSRQASQDLAGTIAGGARNDGGYSYDDIPLAHTLNAKGGSGRIDAESETFISHTLSAARGKSCAHDASHETYVTHALTGEGFDASEDGTGRGTPLVPIAFDCKASGRNGFGVGEVSPTLRAMGHKDSHQNAGGQVAVAVSLRGREGGATAELGGEIMPALSTGGGGGNKAHALTAAAVRRLTPRECERLQGFPDDYTRIPARRFKVKPRTLHFQRYPDLYDCQPDGSWLRHAADGPRYMAIGNSMAVPVMRWLGERIDLAEAVLADLKPKRRRRTA